MSNNKGFTLIEMLMVIVILSIILTVGGVLLGAGFSGGFATHEGTYSGSNARVAFERMSEELKEARSPTVGDLTPNANSITFTKIDGSTVTYSLSGTSLLRNSQVLADYETALTFTYLTSNNITTTDATQVRCIVISTTVSYKNTTLPLQTAVCPRNYVL